ncbi:MAG: DinB family protein [Pirellulaceae bacterium]
MSLSPRLEIAIRHIEGVRAYTHTLLDGLEDSDWFWMPDASITHIAWQVGHIAMAEYGLLLFRQRGRLEIDSELMSGKFRKRFMKGIEPEADRSRYPEPTEILEVLDRVHQQALSELPGFDGDGLDEPLDPPHIAFSHRFGFILFAGDHEMLHCGQIGLLRRLMGKSPVR